jgi:hypothetical protein
MGGGGGWGNFRTEQLLNLRIITSRILHSQGKKSYSNFNNSLSYFSLALFLFLQLCFIFAVGFVALSPLPLHSATDRPHCTPSDNWIATGCSVPSARYAPKLWNALLTEYRVLPHFHQYVLGSPGYYYLLLVASAESDNDLYLHSLSFTHLPTYLTTYCSTVLFVGPWPLFQFLNPIHSR